MIAQLARDVRNLPVAVAVVVLLGGCASSPTESDDGQSGDHRRHVPAQAVAAPRSVADRAATIAMQQVGVPYRYGGQAPTGFDCSGLVHFSYLRAGKPVPRTTAQLWNNTNAVSRSELQRGDLLFFAIDGKMQHVGMYIGDEQFVHAPSSGKRVQVASLDWEYYSDALLRGGRLR